jgi:hypothetical protein
MLTHSKPGKKANPKLYNHFSGKLDGLLAEIFVARGWLKPSGNNKEMFYVTPKGEKYLAGTPTQ